MDKLSSLGTQSTGTVFNKVSSAVIIFSCIDASKINLLRDDPLANRTSNFVVCLRSRYYMLDLSTTKSISRLILLLFKCTIGALKHDMAVILCNSYEPMLVHKASPVYSSNTTISSWNTHSYCRPMLHLFRRCTYEMRETAVMCSDCFIKSTYVHDILTYNTVYIL